jgi:hypothetical protein
VANKYGRHAARLGSFHGALLYAGRNRCGPFSMIEISSYCKQNNGIGRLFGNTPYSVVSTAAARTCLARLFPLFHPLPFISDTLFFALLYCSPLIFDL